MTTYEARFSVFGTCTVEVDSKDEALEMLSDSLFGLSEIDLDDIQIDGADYEIEDEDAPGDH